MLVVCARVDGNDLFIKNKEKSCSISDSPTHAARRPAI